MSERAPGTKRTLSQWSIWIIIAVLLVATVGTTIVMTSAREKPTQRVVIAQVGQASGYEMGLWVAQDLGYFANHGLDVELTRADSAVLVQVLLSGQCQVLSASPLPFLSSAETAATCLDIARMSAVMPWIIVSRADIAGPEDLRGTRFGISIPGVSTVTAVAAMGFRALGLDPTEAGVTFLPAGKSSERLAAVAAGSIDATVVLVDQMPMVQPLIDEGKIRVLVDLTQVDVPWTDADLIVTKAFAAENPKAVDGVLRALVEANAWALDPANKTEALAIVAKYAELDSPDKAEPYYAQALRSLSVRPFPSAEDVRSMVDAMKGQFPELDGAPVDEFIDTGWLDKLEEEGFIDKVAGGQ